MTEQSLPERFRVWAKGLESIAASPNWGVTPNVSKQRLEQARDLRRAADLIEKLPVTADGVYVVPGMTLYRPWYVGDANWSSMPASDGWNVASGEVGQMELSPILGTNDPSQCYAHSENAEKGGA